MKRIICVFLTLVTVLLVLTSCNYQSKDTITDENGKQYIVVRDADGNIVVKNAEKDDVNKLCVYTVNENGKKQKDSNGEYITEYIDFNDQVVIGNTVETVEMRYKLPDNFKDNAENPGYFSKEEYKAEIFLRYEISGYDIAVTSAEKNCESLLENYGSEVFEYEKYTLDIDGVECVAFKQRCTSSEFYKNDYVYIFPYDAGYYTINCSISTDYENKVNFDKFIESIELK